VNIDRYHRQTLLPQIGTQGQEKLRAASVVLIGCGALGTVIADQLTRAGLARFTDGAKACLAADVPTAIAAVKAGLAERAAALDALDAVLEGT